MRRWARGLAFLSISALATEAHAGDVRWTAAGSQPAVAVELARPIVTLERPRLQAAAAAPAATLGRPLALTGAASSPLHDPRVARASYEGSLLTAPRAYARAQTEELHQPMPVGPKGKEAASETIPGPSFTVPPSAAPVVIHGDGMDMPVFDAAPAAAFGTALRGEGFPDDWFWVRGESLMWWINHDRSPVLVTASTDPTTAGALGAQATTVLVDGSRLTSDQPFSGGRINAGWWLTDCHEVAVEGDFLFLGKRTTSFGFSSQGTPILARPFQDVLGVETSQLVAFPGILAGTVGGSSDTQLWGGEIGARVPLWCGCCYQVDFLGGARYLDLQENLRINESLLVTNGFFRRGGFVPTGAQILVSDHFGTKNQFYGGQIGLEGEARWRRWYVDTAAKVGLGNIHEVVNIDGATTFILPAGVATSVPGGLLAQSTNMGHFTRNRFAAVPEGTFKVGYQLTDHLRASVGYTFLYLSNAVRPGEQVDRVVNTTQLPTSMGPSPLLGPARPAVILRETDFWAQGLDFGLELRY